MQAVVEKYTIIKDYERNFAIQLAKQVIYSPKLDVWMILMPIFFVYYFIQKNKYRDGCREFVKHYMVSRKHALDAAVSSLETTTEPDISELAKSPQMSGESVGAYCNFLDVLVKHYRCLLQSKGRNMKELLQSGYLNKTNLLLFFNQLNQTERKLNATLAASMEKNANGYDDAINRIEQASENLRRIEAETIF